jgi:hypothetical protein
MDYLKIVTFLKLSQTLSLSLAYDQIIFQITRQRQTNSLKDGQRHKESCLDLVIVDGVGRVHEKYVVFCPESDHSTGMVKLKFNDKHQPYTKFEQRQALTDRVDWAKI